MKSNIIVSLGMALLLLTACGSGGLDIPNNTWTMISRDEEGARLGISSCENLSSRIAPRKVNLVKESETPEPA